MNPNNPQVTHKQTNTLVESALYMVRKMMQPIIKICLKHGIRMETLTQIIQDEMVQASAFDPSLRTPGHAQNVSRISFQTGLSRVAVNQALSRIEQNDAGISTKDWAIEPRVLQMWAEDPIFQNKEGKPTPLEIRGGPHSFQGLVQRVGKGTSYGPVLESLEAAGCVTREKNQISFIDRKFIPSAISDEEKLTVVARASEIYSYFLQTLEHNLDKNQGDGKYQQSVYTRYCPEDRIPEFLEEVRVKLDSYLEDVTSTIEDFEEKPVKKSLVGVSMFAFTHNNAENLI